MAKEILKYLTMFILLVLGQVTVFNHICLWGAGIPLVFIYFILKLPVSLGINWVMTLSFILGLTVDIFSNTLGVNALACTLLSVTRLPVLRLYMPRQDGMSTPEPSFSTLGIAVFVKYALTLSAVYCSLFFIIEAFTFFSPLQLLFRVVLSSLLTFIIMAAFESLSNRKR